MSEGLRSKVVKGTFWALLERFSSQIVNFSVGIVLARLLTPTDYGTVALLGIFIVIAKVLADSGFGIALVQKKDATELDYNSVFYLSLGMATILYLILFFLAPSIAKFYNLPELCLILRVIAVSLVFNAINSIQSAELSRKLLFHLSFRISLISTVTSAIVGVTLAYQGFGVWALVWSGVASGAIGVVSRWFIIAWRPRLMFSWSALRPLFSYGWKMTCSGVLDTFFENIYGVIIGKFYTRADLSFVNKGRNIPELLMSNINGTLGGVAFPALAKLQDDKIRLRETMRRMMVVSTFFVFPLMTVCALVSERAILFLYGEKWLPAVPYAMIACFTFALWPFHTINLQGLQAMGRSDVFLKLEIIKKTMALIVLASCLSQGVLLWCLVAAFVSNPLSVAINAWPNRKLLNYTIRMQFFDVLPVAFICMVAAVPLIAINIIDPVKHDISTFSLFITLILQGVLFVVVYLSIAYVFRVRGLREVVEIFKPRLLSWFPNSKRFYEYLEVR